MNLNDLSSRLAPKYMRCVAANTGMLKLGARSGQQITCNIASNLDQSKPKHPIKKGKESVLFKLYPPTATFAINLVAIYVQIRSFFDVFAANTPVNHSNL